MNDKMPRTPFSTPLSGSARETEIRIRNIMSGPKKRPPVLFLALMFSVCIFCGNLVSCHVAEAEQSLPDSSLQPEEVSQPEPKEPEYLPASELSFDINQNGVPEEVRLENEYGWDEVRFYENGQLIDRELPGVCVYRYPLGGPDHILRCHDDNDCPGSYYYSYSISDFSGEFEEVIKSNSVSFDLNFGAPFHRFDPAAIAAYVEELTGPAGLPSLGLFSHAWRLVVRDGELAVEAPEQPLPWLDQFPEVFTPDPDKSLEENLRDFQAAMTADWTPPAPENDVELLFDWPIEMTFSSGAGAWQTVITLHGDGTFQGDYKDADLDIHYVCQFHGRFGDMVQLSDNSWYLVLKELVLDTKYPVGREWDEGGIHYISSDPYGFNTLEGGALEPGAEFIFYYPGATGHEPGTELYGAYEFWTWWPNRHIFQSSSDTLGCYGLHSLETGYGFFSDR